MAESAIASISPSEVGRPIGPSGSAFRKLEKAGRKTHAIIPAQDLKERFKHLIRERSLESRPDGYPRLAALINSDNGFVMYRRFGYIHNRILLHRQAEIVELEKDLDKLDDSDYANPDLRFRCRLTTREFLEGDDTEQKVLIDKLEEKLKSYDDLLFLEMKLRAVKGPTKIGFGSLYNYMWQRKPLEEGEDDFIYRYEDFISLADTGDGSWLDDLVGWLIASLHGKFLLSCLASSDDLKKSTDKGIQYYSDSRLAIFIKILVALTTVALLMTPVWLIILVDMSAVMMLVTVLLFVCAFLTVLSLFTAVKRQDIFIGGATYCAVLVVFLGTIKHS